MPRGSWVASPAIYRLPNVWETSELLAHEPLRDPFIPYCVPPKPYEVTWLTPTTGPRSQGKPYLTTYGADMTLREGPPGAELPVTEVTYASGAASNSGPRLRHIAGGLRPAHPTGDRRPAGRYRLFARSVDEKVRLQAVPDLAFTP